MSGSRPPITVVIIDGDVDTRFIARLTLERAGGFEVLAEAEGGDTGLDLVRDLQPDLVLLDVDLPGISGIEVLGQIREARPGTTVLIHSSCFDPSVLTAARLGGAAGYILKGGLTAAFASRVQGSASTGYAVRGRLPV